MLPVPNSSKAATCEIWRGVAPSPGATVELARRAEGEGWDGIALNDSQCLACDPFIEITLAAAATSRLRFATAVTNPVSRHPAVLASMAATIQAESEGRMVIGIGRGDSALAHLGLPPAGPEAFERFVATLQALLRGESVAFGVDDAARSSGSLSLGDRPASMKLHWLAGLGVSKVPVEIAASGPRVLSIAGRQADRVLLAAGVNLGQITWARGVVLAAAEEAGRPPEAVHLALNVPIFVHEDWAAARRAIAGAVSATARFSAMTRRAELTGPRGLRDVARNYDMNEHGSAQSRQARSLTDDVIDAFGIAGPASYCVERLVELRELGVRKLHLRSASLGVDPEVRAASDHALATQVLPRIR